MLGKLVKHEMAATGRLLFPLQGILLIISVVGWLLLNLRIFDEHVEVGVIMLIFYIMFIYAIAVATNIYLAVRFYKNLFTDEGYLSFTLPVKPYMHLWSKGISMAIWQVINMVMVVLSVCILLCYQNILGEVISELWNTDWSVLGEVGLSLPGIICFSVAYLIISGLFSITAIFVSVCIGQLANTYKAAASIVTYVIIQICYQIISSILSSITMMGDLFGTTMDAMYDDMSMVVEYSDQYYAASMVDMYANTFWVTMIFAGILSVIFYIVSHIIVCKRVNLQ